jgi:hypothetical protein
MASWSFAIVNQGALQQYEAIKNYLLRPEVFFQLRYQRAIQNPAVLFCFRTIKLLDTTQVGP